MRAAKWFRRIGTLCVLATAGQLSGQVARGEFPPTEAESSDDLPSYLRGPSTTVAALIQETGAVDGVGGLDLPADAVDVDDVTNRSLFSDRQTELIDGKFRLPPIKALTTGTDEIGNGELPVGFRNGEVSPVIGLPESGAERGLPWEWNSKIWAAANTFSHPLYFEDRMLERHGHQLCPHFQPALAGGRFIAQAAMLPYLATIAPPCECQYTLGYYRVGSCAPKLKQRPPYKRKAAAAQAAFVTGAVFALP